MRPDPRAQPSTPSYAGTYYGSIHPRPVKMPSTLQAAVRESVLGNSELSGGLQVRNRVNEAVEAYWLALKQNADAQLDER